MGKQDLEIARAVTLKPIHEVAATVGLAPAELEPFGHYKAKVAWDAIERRRAQAAVGGRRGSGRRCS